MFTPEVLFANDLWPFDDSFINRVGNVLVIDNWFVKDSKIIAGRDLLTCDKKLRANVWVTSIEKNFLLLDEVAKAQFFEKEFSPKKESINTLAVIPKIIQQYDVGSVPESLCDKLPSTQSNIDILIGFSKKTNINAPNKHVFLRLNSIQKYGEFIEVWTFWYHEFDSTPAVLRLNAIDKFLVDCENKKLAAHSGVEYSKEGDVKNVTRLSSYKFDDFIPDSIGESIGVNACNWS